VIIGTLYLLLLLDQGPCYETQVQVGDSDARWLLSCRRRAGPQLQAHLNVYEAPCGKKTARILLPAGYTWLQQPLFKNRRRCCFITGGFTDTEALGKGSPAHNHMSTSSVLPHLISQPFWKWEVQKLIHSTAYIPTFRRKAYTQMCCVRELQPCLDFSLHQGASRR
jgi:hypothetical protein